VILLLFERLVDSLSVEWEYIEKGMGRRTIRAVVIKLIMIDRESKHYNTVQQYSSYTR
jgi:hypothetical protein